jgi:ABC-2 type transport system ATP-binding protein
VVRGIDISEIGDRACAAGIALHELTPQAGSLEELFLGWTSNSATHDRGSATAEVSEPDRQAVPL